MVENGYSFWPAKRKHKTFRILGEPVGISGMAAGKAIDASTHIRGLWFRYRLFNSASTAFTDVPAF